MSEIYEETEKSPFQNAEKRGQPLTRADSIAVAKIDAIDDSETKDFYGSSTTDSYRLKSEIVSKCMSEIGMGRFQWELFVINGFGYIVDNLASQGLSAVQPPIQSELPHVRQVSYSSVAYYVGLVLGASFWGISADFIGRKPAFNCTLLIAGVFMAACGGAMNFVAFSAFWAVIGTAAGGNVPVDSLIFLEFVPGSHQWLLTSLSAWWNLGQLIVSLIAWVFLANFGCPTNSTPETCKRGENMGWRYTMITVGALALLFTFTRTVLFHMPETPRYLLSKGRDSEAVEAVNWVARRNKRPEPITMDMLETVDVQLGLASSNNLSDLRMSNREIVRENLRSFHGVQYKALFATKQLGRHTGITWFIWLIIGIAYPLYFNFLPSYISQKFPSSSSSSSLYITYRNYCLESAVGIIGPISAGFLVNVPRLGRRWMMGISSVITGVFMFAYVGLKTEAGSVAFSCVTGLLGNFEYAVMYAFTPESFPAPHRGTGTGTAATLLRFGGLVASLISSQCGFTSAPMYVSAALWIAAGFVCFGLPFETRHHAAI